MIEADIAVMVPIVGVLILGYSAVMIAGAVEAIQHIQRSK